VLGPRTEAWEHIRARIASGRGVRDQDDAITQGMIYVAEDLDEIWIPTSMVADAVESVETSRRALQSELAERGIDSNELSGSGISEAMTSNGTTARFWRLDATHDEVPEPEIVLDEADDPTERSADVENDDQEDDQDDSGPTNGPETFGRDPEAGDDSDEDAADGGDVE